MEELPTQTFHSTEVETLIKNGESERLEFKTSFGREVWIRY